MEESGFEIAGEWYGTKAALERHYRAIIANKPAGTTIGTESVDFWFLLGILRRHDRRAEKIGDGVREFFVVDVPGAKGIWIRRCDGSETDVSLLKTIQRMGLTPRQRAQQDVVRTLRDEIEYQIAEYRQRALQAGLDTVDGEFRVHRHEGPGYRELLAYHVDHESPTFAELVEGFLIEQRLDVETIAILHGEQGERCRIADPGIATAWQEYHRRHAKLRLLPADENLRRRSPRIDWKRIDEHVRRDPLRGKDAMEW